MQLQRLNNSPIYPTLNIHFSPRVFQQRVDFKNKPLSKYIGSINNQSTQLFQGPQPNQLLLRAFSEKDGMIHHFKQMEKDQSIKSTNKSNIKIMICVCMYNQSAGAIQLTLQGIYNNLKGLQKQGISHEQIAVVLIQDGILKLVADRNTRTYAKGDDSMINFYKKLDKSDKKNKCDLQQRIHTILDSIQQYNRRGQPEGYRNNQDFPKNIQKNISLLYQNLWKPSKTKQVKQQNQPNKNQIQNQNDQMLLKVFSCFKHTNGTKLSSHLLFFQGFCRYLNPQFVVLLDVGTKPDNDGIVNLIRGFYSENIGGVTGLMSIDAQFPSLQDDSDKKQQNKNWLQNFALSIPKAQQYQYVIAHFLDKNAQSALGFLHVLPGAWSAYRYQALIKSDKYEPNLLQKRYFKMILNPELEQKDYRQANMYLAEDRILSLGIYCQMKSNYILKYVPNAIAYTDPMQDHVNLMNQRRRWINSSLFAFQYVLQNYFHHVEESNHNWFRRYFTLNISMLLALLSLINSYFTPAIYFFVLYITIAQIQENSTSSANVAAIVSAVYCLLILAAVGGSLAGKRWVKRAHVLSYALSFFTFGMFGLVTYNLLIIYINLENIDMNKFNTASVVIMAFINIGCFGLLLFMHMLAPVHWKFVGRLILDTISYMTFQGAYSLTMVIYAFCNVDDVSWGTKGAGSSGKKKYQAEKVFFVSKWLFFNALLAYIFIYVDLVIPQRTGAEGGKVLLAIALYATSVMLLKTILAAIYYFKWLFCQYYCQNHIKIEPQNRKQKVQEFWKKKTDEYRIHQNQHFSNAIANH